MNNLKNSFLNEACSFDGKRFRVDTESTLHNGAALAAVASQIWQDTQHLAYTFLIAPGAGSGPLAAAITLAAQSKGSRLDILQLKDPARYPERTRMSSGLVPPVGSNVLIVDDCVLSGRSVRNTLAELARQNIAVNIVGIATLYDHEDLRGSRSITASGIPIFSVLQRTALGLSRRALSDEAVLGHMLWTRRGYELKRARSCAPVIVDGMVIVADDSCRVWGVDLVTGDDVWCIEPLAVHGKGINNDFCVVDGHLFFSTYAGELVRAEAATGNMVWRRKVDHACHSAPVYDAVHNRLYLNCESSVDGQPAGHLRAFDAESGVQLWALQHDDLAPCQPGFDGQRVFATSNAKTLICADLDGRLLWQVDTIGLVRGAVWVDDLNGTCITYSETGHLQCFNAATGAQIWMRRVSTGSNHVAPYWSKGCIVLSDLAGYLFGVDPFDGRIQWASRLRSPSAWRPTKCEGGFIVTTAGGNVARFDHSGTKLLEQPSKLTCFAPAAVGAGYAVFLTLDGRLVCHQMPELNTETST
jgi:outer membrane protein assembly factor BamB/orotate phosphoribosyltransferase